MCCVCLSTSSYLLTAVCPAVSQFVSIQYYKRTCGDFQLVSEPCNLCSQNCGCRWVLITELNVGRVICDLKRLMGLQGGHKPGILRDFSEHGNSQVILCNLREKL